MGSCKKTFFLSLFLLNILLIEKPWAAIYQAPSRPMPKDSYEIYGDVSYWKSESAIDKEGQETTFDNETSYTLLESNLVFKYAFGAEIELMGGMRMRQVEAQYATTNATQKGTNSGLESFTGGFKWFLGRSKDFSYALNLAFRQTNYTNKDYLNVAEIPQDEVLLGDSGSSYHVGVNLDYFYRSDMIVESFLAYRQPANDLSTEVVYDVSLKVTWPQTILGLGVGGVSSLQTDSSVSETRTLQEISPSALFNSYNRSWVEPHVGIEYQIGSFIVGLEGSSRLSGVSTDKGQRVLLSLKKRSGGKSPEEIKKNSFKEYNIEGTVMKVSPRGKFLKIDIGLAQDVEKGMSFDIYQTDFFGGNELVATAVAYEVAADKSILKVVKKYSQIKIKKGFQARSK